MAAVAQWLVVKLFIVSKRHWTTAKVEDIGEKEISDKLSDESTGTCAEQDGTESIDAVTPDKPFTRMNPYQINLHARPLSEPPILEYSIFSSALEETSKLLGPNIPNRLRVSVLDGIFEGAFTLKYAMWMEDALAEALRVGDEDMIRWYVGLKMGLKEDMQEDRVAFDSREKEFQKFNKCLTEEQKKKFRKLWAPSFDTQRM